VGAEASAVIGQRRQVGMIGFDHKTQHDCMVAAGNQLFDQTGEPAGWPEDVGSAAACYLSAIRRCTKTVGAMPNRDTSPAVGASELG
jgi:hypothetical protein